MDYVKFYFFVPGLDLYNGLRYLSIDADTQELCKCLDPINPKIDIYVKHVASVQKQLLVRDVSVVNTANLVGCGVGVEDVNVDDVDGDGDGDDNEVDAKDGNEVLADDEFEENDNLVNEGNDARGNDGDGVMGDVNYEWYDSNYERPGMVLYFRPTKRFASCFS